MLRSELLNYLGYIFFNQNIYVCNLPTRTVYNLLQKLNYVKRIQFFVVKQENNITHIMCEISEQYLDYYAKHSLFGLNGSKLEVAKIEFWAKICFKKKHYFLEAKTTPKN